ncbi:MAG: hypothetical protein AAGP08_10925 [Pseudomonadota bacterium]
MIRLLFHLVVFAIGLGAALLWFGEMRHLRQVISPLPAWAALIDSDARVLRGAARAPDGIEPQMALRWQAETPRVDGLHWALTLSGNGVEAIASAVLPFTAEKLIIRRGRGTISLEDLTNGSAAGLYRIASIESEIWLRPQRPATLEIRLDPTTPLTPEATDALARVAEIEGNLLRIPLNLP